MLVIYKDWPEMLGQRNIKKVSRKFNYNLEQCKICGKQESIWMELKCKCYYADKRRDKNNQQP
jgi:hypothetical protein